MNNINMHQRATNYRRLHRLASLLFVTARLAIAARSISPTGQ